MAHSVAFATLSRHTCTGLAALPAAAAPTFCGSGGNWLQQLRGLNGAGGRGRRSVVTMKLQPKQPAPGSGSGSSSRAVERRRTKLQKRDPAVAVSEASVQILKRSRRWACVKSCGACCYLQPGDRPDLKEWLEPEQLSLYMSMVSPDGWCKHFDKDNRACTIYADRPSFCMVTPETFGDMYGIDPDEMDSFCTACCREQITDVYGKESQEMRRFNTVVAELSSNVEGGGAAAAAAAPMPVDPFSGAVRNDQVFTWGGNSEWVDDSDDEGDSDSYASDDDVFSGSEDSQDSGAEPRESP